MEVPRGRGKRGPQRTLEEPECHGSMGIPAWWEEKEIGFTGSCEDNEGTL